jgi:hypothetical protein
VKQERPITEEEFARRTAPTVRLFFSVDLENSTRLKQSAERLSEAWLSAVLLFIRGFPQLFEAQLQERARTKGVAKQETPPVWKVLGDELIFVAVVRKRFEVLALVESFREALRIWNEDVRRGNERGPLMVKGAAWLAGFPLANAIFEAADGREDYAGPSIDAGFRIGKLATPRRLALSVDLAWLLLKSDFPGNLHFNGPTAMKGVAEEMGYPALWIEVGKSEYVRKEAHLLGRGTQESRDEMIALCAEFIREFGVPNYPPFLSDETDLTPKPPGYDEQLSVVKEFLRQKVYFVDEERTGAATPLSSEEEKDLLDQVKQQEESDRE